MINPGALSIIGWFFEVLTIAALIFEGFAFADVLRRPKQAFVAVSKQNKPIWMVITGVATVIGLGSAVYGTGPIGILTVAAFVAAAIYLTDVRPKVKDFRKPRSGAHMGPYGPW